MKEKKITRFGGDSAETGEHFASPLMAAMAAAAAAAAAAAGAPMPPPPPHGNHHHQVSECRECQVW